MVKAILIIYLSPGNGLWISNIVNYDSMEECQAVIRTVKETSNYTDEDVDRYLKCEEVHE